MNQELGFVWKQSQRPHWIEVGRRFNQIVTNFHTRPSLSLSGMSCLALTSDTRIDKLYQNRQKKVTFVWNSNKRTKCFKLYHSYRNGHLIDIIWEISKSSPLWDLCCLSCEESFRGSFLVHPPFNFRQDLFTKLIHIHFEQWWWCRW